MSLIKTNRTSGGMAAIGARAKDRAKDAAGIGARAKDRAKDAAGQAVPMGKRAGTTAVHRVRQGVQDAREWAAPRLEDAADAVTASVAPKVSSLLRSAARQVRPEGTKPPAKTGIRRLLNWRWLLGAGAVMAAAGGTAAVAMRRRYASATAEAKSATESADEAPAQDGESVTDTASRAEVNGRVTAPGR